MIGFSDLWPSSVASAAMNASPREAHVYAYEDHRKAHRRMVESKRAVARR